MELSSDSDDEDCQLYTRAAENIELKRKNLQAKFQILEVSDVEMDLPTGKTLSHSPIIESNGEFSVSSVVQPNDSDDDISLAELSRRLSSKKNKKSSKRLTQKSSRPRHKKHSRFTRKGRNGRTKSVRNLGVIILDDDTGYPSNELSPIDFNSRSKKRTLTPDDTLYNISLNSNLSVDLDEGDNCYESDNLVTVIVDWSDGHKEFKLRRFQKIETIYEELAKMEGLPVSRILLMHNFNTVKPSDTPSSLNFKFYGTLTGAISASEINHNRLNLDELEEVDLTEDIITVKLKLESQQTLHFKLKKQQKMDVLFQKCCEELQCEENKIKITFDGESIDRGDVVADLEVDDGDVFHVHIKQ